MRTSYSALETYKQCPQKYKYEQVDKRRVAKGKEAIFGTLIHGALQFMFSKDPLFPTVDEVVAHFRDAWAEAKIARITPEEEALYLKQGEALLKRFYEKNPPWNFGVVDLESRFELAIEDPKNNTVHTLAGIMDRIDKTGDTYEIIDYKTTRRMASQESVDQNLQLSLYHLGLTKRWPHIAPENITLSLYYVKHNEKISTHRSAEMATIVKARMLDTIREIEEHTASGEFPATPSALCDWCAYKPLCPAWRHLYKKAETTEDIDVQKTIAEYFEIKKAEDKNKKRIAELQSAIKTYLEKENLDRLFSDQGSISKKLQQRFAYKFEDVKEIFETARLADAWPAILSPDEKKLKLYLKTLSPEVREKVEMARELTKSFVVLTASTKKVKADSDAVEVGEEEK